jgi:hypothetical protein
MRFLPSVPDYIYAHRGDSLYINLFVASKASIEMQKGTVDIEQETGYPWDGSVTVKLNPKAESEFALLVRIPGWVDDQPLPGDLYHYFDQISEGFTLTLNGRPIEFEMNKGFAAIRREWSAGDILQLELPMPVRRVLADEKVEENQNRVALVRGPIVYCAEWADNGGMALDFVLPDNADLSTERRDDLLGGITVVRGAAMSTSGMTKQLVAIPYYAWSHRGPGEMQVWLSRKTEGTN